MKQKILLLIANEVGQPVSESQTLESLDIDSLEFLDLIVSISREIGQDIPDSRIDGLQTVGDLVTLAESLA